MRLQIDVITLFPEMLKALNYGIVGRAIQQGLIQLNPWNPRDFTTDIHRTVDDRPYGGGPGMVMKYEPLQKAIEAAQHLGSTHAPVILLSPQGQTLQQENVVQFSQQKRLILVSGRYEGIDERLIKTSIDEEWSIGDYVLSGGELPAMVLIDAIVRLLPGALGHEDSARFDSFSTGLLDYPQYTRPEVLGEHKVPPVLLGGDHAAIKRWRLKQSLGKTWQKRRDLLKRRVLTAEEKNLLDEFIKEEKIHESDYSSPRSGTDEGQANP